VLPTRTRRVPTDITKLSVVQKHGDDSSSAKAFTYRLKLYLSTTRLGLTIDLADLALSLAYCAAYVVETAQTQLSDAHIIFNVVCAFAFTAYFMLCVLLAQARRAFLLSTSSLLDVASVLAVVPLLAVWGNRTFAVQLLRLGAVARISHLEALDRLAKTDIDRQVFA
jgi:hypothetical protein